MIDLFGKKKLKAELDNRIVTATMYARNADYWQNKYEETLYDLIKEIKGSETIDKDKITRLIEAKLSIYVSTKS